MSPPSENFESSRPRLWKGLLLTNLAFQEGADRPEFSSLSLSCLILSTQVGEDAHTGAPRSQLCQSSDSVSADPSSYIRIPLEPHIFGQQLCDFTLEWHRHSWAGAIHAWRFVCILFVNWRWNVCPAEQCLWHPYFPRTVWEQGFP